MNALGRRKRRQGRRMAIRIVGHVRFDLLAKLIRHGGALGVGDQRGVLLEVGRRVPSWGGLERSVVWLGGHQRSMPPRTGSSIARVAIMSAM